MSFPSLSPPSSGLVESMTLAQPTRLLASSSKTTGFTMLVNGVDDPVDPGITANCLVLRVYQDDLKVLICGVLVDPVGVKDPQVRTPASNTLLGRRLQRTLVLELVNTLVCGFSVSGTFGHWTLPSTTADANTIDDIALLGLVA